MSIPDPKKVLQLKPGQRRLRRRKHASKGKGQWQEHRGEHALDPWGTAIRDMQRAGTWPEEEA